MTGLSWLLPTAQAQPGVYFISDDGDDGDPGTEQEPWKTIAHAQTVLSNGDELYFRRGDTFEGPLALVGRNNILFGAYGTGANPIITGSIPINTGWSYESLLSGTGYFVYSTVIPVDYELIKQSSDFGVTLRPMLMAYQGADMLTLARTPNATSTYPGTDGADWYYQDDWEVYEEDDDPIEPGPPFSSLQDAALNGMSFSSNNPQFPQVVIRTQNFSIQVKDVNFFDPINNRFQFFGPIDASNHASDPHLWDGWGYFIQNYIEALDSPGEWFAEPDGNDTRLYVVMSSQVPPASGAVEVATNGACFRFTNCSNITVQDLVFQRAFFGVTFYATTTQVNNVVRDCSFKDLVIGVEITADGTNEGHIIENNVFKDIHDMGIHVYADQMTISGNTLSDIGRQPGRGEGVIGWGYFGIRADGNGVDVRDNVLHDLGYVGIMAYGDGTQVRRNHITRWNSLLNDGGGIFFEGGNGMVVEDNVVMDSEPNMVGVSEEFSSNFPFSVGIYFGQNHLYNATARNNTVSGCEIGMVVDHMLDNEVETHTITGNTLFGNRSTQLYITDMSNKVFDEEDEEYEDYLGWEIADGVLHIASYPDVYTGNIMYALNSRQRCMTQISHWASDEDALVDYGIFEGNHYHNPFSDVAILQLFRFYRGQDIDFYLAPTNDPKPLPWTLDGWRNRFQEESTGTRSPLRLKDYHITGPVAQQPTGIGFLNHTFGENDEGLLGPWNSSSQNAPQGLSAFRFPEDTQQPMEALEHRDWYWFENWASGSVLGDGQPDPPVGHYRVTFNMRSPNVDMVGLSHLTDGTYIVDMQFCRFVTPMAGARVLDQRARGGHVLGHLFLQHALRSQPGPPRLSNGKQHLPGHDRL